MGISISNALKPLTSFAAAHPTATGLTLGLGFTTALGAYSGTHGDADTTKFDTKRLLMSTLVSGGAITALTAGAALLGHRPDLGTFVAKEAVTNLALTGAGATTLMGGAYLTNHARS